MTGPTHRQFSISFAYLVIIGMYTYGMLSVDIGSSIPNYYMALIIVLYTARKGALFPDVDHDWEFVKEKTAVNYILNKIIHITGGTHRSWQTHSWDICIWFTAGCVIVPKVMYSKSLISELNMQIFYIIALGFCTGWISHTLSDMLNGVGVRLVCWSKKTVAFVPKRIGKFKFNTGEEWEAFCMIVVKGINKFLFFVTILYPLFGLSWVHDLFGKIAGIIGGTL